VISERWNRAMSDRSTDFISAFPCATSRQENARQHCTKAFDARTFFAQMVREKYRKDDPTALVEGPKVPKRVPRVADEKTIDLLVRQPKEMRVLDRGIGPCLNFFMAAAYGLPKP